MYSKAILLGIQKMFLKSKSQIQLAVLYKGLLKAKLLDVYLKKLYMDCFYF